MEAVSVYVQVGGRLDEDTWRLVVRLADEVAADEPEVAKDSNGIWELRTARPLVDGDIGRWLVLDRALWIARGLRPWRWRRHWKAAREVIAGRVRSSLDADGMLPQAYDEQGRNRPDASALMAVAFGMLDRDEPCAHRVVDVLIERLGTGPFLRRYPPGDDGFAGSEGAFLPVSFLAVTALARLGRVDEATKRMDEMCAAVPRLLSEEVEPETGRLLGNTPLVWSHAELARALYVLDAARRQQRWGRPVLWAWRVYRYAALRHADQS